MLACKGKVLVWGMVVVLGGLVVGPVWAGEKVSNFGAAERRILAALDESTTIEFIEEPLASVVDFLKDYHQIAIQIDEPALEGIGIGTDEPANKHLAGVSLRSALNLVLHDLGLDWTIANEVLVITTPEVAKKTMFTRVYDVGDQVLARDADGELWRDFDSMIDVLTSTVEPETWESVGGAGRIAPFEVRGAAGLVVRHTPKVHHEISRLLLRMSELGSKYDDGVYPVRDPKPTATCSNARAASGDGAAESNPTGKVTESVKRK